MRKRILLIGDYSDNDISALNSTDGPLSYFNDLFEVSYPPEKDGWWNNFRNWLYVDCALVHRPWSDRHRKIMDAAKLHGVKLWVHHDDDLTCIPKSNICWGITDQQRFDPVVEYSYQIADLLTVQSTLMYNEAKNKRLGETLILPVCLHDRLLQFQKNFTNNHRVAWRGSVTHVSDLMHFQKPLQEIFDKYSHYEFHFFGIDPLVLGFKIKNVVLYNETTMWQFYKNFTDLNPSTLLIPLEDNKFNRVKSHLSWLDGTLAGARCIVPDFYEFDHRGVYKYSCPEALVETFEMCVNDTNPGVSHALSCGDFGNYLISERRDDYKIIWSTI